MGLPTTTGNDPDVGDIGDVSTLNTVLGLLGDPSNAGVVPGVEGSMFSWLRQMYIDLGGAGGGTAVQQGKFDVYPARDSSAELSVDPTENETAAGNTSSTNRAVLVEYEITFQEGTNAIVDNVFSVLHWSTQMDAGTGNSAWYIVDDAQITTAGTLLSAIAGETKITSDFSATADKTVYVVSGLIRTDAFPANGNFKIFLAGDVANAVNTLTTTVVDSTKLEVNYHRV